MPRWVGNNREIIDQFRMYKMEGFVTQHTVNPCNLPLLIVILNAFPKIGILVYNDRSFQPPGLRSKNL